MVLLAYTNNNGSSSSEEGRSTRKCTLPRKGSEKSAESIGKTQRASSVPRYVAHARSSRLEGLGQRASSTGPQESQSSGSSEDVAYSLCKRRQQKRRSSHGNEKGHERRATQDYHESECSCESRIRQWREAVSAIRRTSDGVPRRVDRIKALGNAVVPSQAREAFRILSGIA